MQRLLNACALAMLLAPFAPARAEGYDLGSFRLALIDDPVRIEFQDGSPVPAGGKLQELIKSAAASRGWKVTELADGRIELLNVVRDEHVVSIEITYDAIGYRIRYLKSANLLYAERGARGSNLRVIHKNYNEWINELVRAINGKLEARTQTTIGFAPVDSVLAVPFLGQSGRDAYSGFLRAGTPRAFAIAPNGSWGVSSGREPYRTFSDRQDATELALARCNSRPPGQCRLYAVDSRVVWTAPNPPPVSGPLAGSALLRHVERLTEVQANPGTLEPFILSVSAEGKAWRICKVCSSPGSGGSVTVKSEEGLVCFRWEGTTYPDSGCFRVVPISADAFEMRGTSGERPIRYSLPP